MPNDPFGLQSYRPGAQLPPPVPPPHVHWTDRISALGSLLSAGIAGLAVAKDSPPGLLVLLLTLVVTTAWSPVANTIRQFRARRRAREAALAQDRAQTENLERVTIAFNSALKLVGSQLAARNNSSANTITYAIQQLTGYLKPTPLSQEAQFLRDNVFINCKFIDALPTEVNPTQARVLGYLLDQTVHRLIENLPKYITACEQAADQLEGPDSWKRERTYEQADLLRQRTNEFIREYNSLAKQTLAPGIQLLEAFDVEKYLRTPVRLPPPKS